MRVLVVVGTRPEAIKMAPVIQELLRRPHHFQARVCLTAQHRELLDQVIEFFQIPVHFDLNLMSPGQQLPEITAAIVTGLSPVLQAWRPEMVLVHGDTTTSFAAALAAYYEQIPVAHVEAGLRTYQHYAPFPEEMNRRLCDALCTWHYAPTEGARTNLRHENIPDEQVLVTGNPVVDALLHAAAQPLQFHDPLLESLGRDRRLLLVTAHRRESFGQPLREMCRALRSIVERNSDVEAVYPVHPNPQVRAVVEELLRGQDRIHLIPPLEYLPFVHLLKKSRLVLTDSGGIQEEAPSLDIPVLLMREVTERPEAVAAGAVRLVGTAYDAIVGAVQQLLDDQELHQRMSACGNPYGDGKAALRIVDHLDSLRQ